MAPTSPRIAAAWLSERDWPRWTDVDPQLQLGYGHWLRRMEEIVADIEKRGGLVDKIDVDLAEFLEWSRLNGGEVDTKARAKFAAFLSTKRQSHH